MLPAVNGRGRLESRFSADARHMAAAVEAKGKLLGPEEALSLGLITVAPDDLDWEDEVRIAIEERASLSPDALTGMEASLRFPGSETVETKVFGRLSAWQNWVFIRPNSTGENGALKLFGTGKKAKFNWERV
jgi:benzoyl-CoA-dihydrodiol lyase